ncbi:MAG TPA: enoyl-CoA hydratase [Stellaceae bacterium]|nr:enoyl-CoA hydratase [Stellaceae bacterium]
MDEVLLETVEDGVLTLTLNRPDRLNALSWEMCDRLQNALVRAAAERAVGAIVLTGAGRAFCAGGDVKSMAEASTGLDGYEERIADLRRRMECARLLHEIAKPTIAMVRGPAAGAGLSLALACDLRIAGEEARFTTAFAKVGLSGDFGGHYFLTRLVGTAKARELYLLSPVLDAKAALALGMVNRVVSDASLADETRALARALANGPRIALGYMKQNLNLAESASLAQVMDAEALRHTRCATTEDHREAAAAFVAKRPPVFSGR